MVGVNEKLAEVSFRIGIILLNCILSDFRCEVFFYLRQWSADYTKTFWEKLYLHWKLNSGFASVHKRCCVELSFANFGATASFVA